MRGRNLCLDDGLVDIATECRSLFQTLMRNRLQLALALAFGACAPSACGGRMVTVTPAPDASSDAGSAPDVSFDVPPPLDSGSAPMDTSVAEAACADGVDGGAWVDDPCLWQAVPGLEACRIDRAVLPGTRIPTRVWADCGAGCQSTPAGRLGMPDTSIARGYADASGAFVRLGYLRAGGPSLVEFYDAEHDRTAAALAIRTNSSNAADAVCVSIARHGLGPSAIEQYIVDWGPSATTEDVLSARVTFLSHGEVEPLGIEKITGDIDPRVASTDGIGFVAEAIGLRIARFGAPTSFATEVPMPPPGPGIPYWNDVTAFGDTFAWTSTDAHSGECPTSGSIHTWSPSRGHVELHRPVPPLVVAVGADGLVWWEATCVIGSNGYSQPANVALWWLPPGSDTPKHLADGPAGFDVGEVAIGGGWIASQHESDLGVVTSRLSVVELATGKTWVLGPAPLGCWSWSGMTTGGGVLLAGDGHCPGPTIHTLYRFDLANIDAIAAKFPVP